MTRPGDGIGGRDPIALSSALDALGTWIERIYEPRASGLQHLALPGAALLVGNHSGGPLAMIEPLVLAHAARRALGDAQLPHLLLHEIMWHTPLAPWLASLGAVRASQENAHALLDAERPVLVYPGGDREAFRTFRHRDRIEFGPRRGYIRLAIERGVPVVPVVTAGMHSGFVCLNDGHALAQRFPLAKACRVGVLPITLSAPFGLGIGVPPPYVPLASRVRIRVLAPIHFTRHGVDAAADEQYVEACHRTLVGAMQRALEQLADQRREERRRAFHERVDRVLDAIERFTLAARDRVAPVEGSIAPLEHAAAKRAA